MGILAPWDIENWVMRLPVSAAHTNIARAYKGKMHSSIGAL